MDAAEPKWRAPMAPGGPPVGLDHDPPSVVDDGAVASPVVIVPARLRSVPAALVRNGLFVAVTILLVLFLLPAALGAAGPAVVGG